MGHSTFEEESFSALYHTPPPGKKQSGKGKRFVNFHNL
jgi:hypothetical protein